MKPNLRISIQTLLEAGKAQREIERVLGVDRKTIRRIQLESKSPGVATGNCAEKAADRVEDPDQNPPPRPPAPKAVATPSACEIRREWIESQVTLGRNAMSLYQGPGGEVRVHAPVQLGQALRREAQGTGT